MAVDLKTLKALARKFSDVRADRAAVSKLASETEAAHPHDDGVQELCRAMRATANATEVDAVAKEVTDRTV